MKKLVLFSFLALGSLAGQATIRNVTEGGNLSAAIRRAAAVDTLVLAPGNYRVEGTIPVARNLVVMSEKGARASVSFSTFIVGAGARHLCLENLDITINHKYLVQTADVQCDIDLIRFKSCNIDVGGTAGATLVTSATDSEDKNRIGEISLEDCMVYNAGFPMHAIFSAGSTSKTRVEKITIQGCTVANTARGLVVSGAAMDGCAVTLRGSTFYRLNTTDNESGTIRLSNVKADVTIEGCVFNFAGPKSRFIVVAKGGKIGVTDSWMTGEMASMTGQSGLGRLDGNAAAIFAAPGGDPTAAGVSFKIKDAPAANAGDPRWK